MLLATLFTPPPATPPPATDDLDRLGDEIVALAAHLDGTLSFSTPAGRPIPEAPAVPAVPAEPARSLVAGHRALGLAIHGRTGCPTWLGERLDLGWAIDVLHPLSLSAPGAIEVEPTPSARRAAAVPSGASVIQLGHVG